ncbi:MAG TPA: lysylphosphatidylglycerol synthase transmembrane domain-containing protein [Vicinamibacterales bacterium]|nr:lysylphosphatidylglycerol synthase transmembrane domain-containing protein [Vicinamibacterales bacterium]
MSGQGTGTRGRRLLRSAPGYLIGAACLAWVFHDVELGPMLDAARTMRWGFVALAIGFDVLSYVVQGVRWKLLLMPVGKLSWLDATQAVYAGLFANEILPMRAGEVLRGYVVGQRLHLSLPAVIPSMIVERLFDGVWLAIALGVAATVAPLPPDLLRAGDVLGLTIVVASGLFLFVALRKPSTARHGTNHVSAGSTSRVTRWIAEVRAGCQQIGLRPGTYLALTLSLAILICQMLAFWLVMIAYRLDFAFWIGAVVLIIVRFGTLVPGAPADVGTYQFFCVLGLTLFGVGKTQATGFAVVVFLVLTVPLWAIGAVAVSRTGAGLMLRARRN